MKKSLLILLLSVNATLFAQEEIDVNNDIILEDSSIEKYSGNVVMNGDDISLETSSCEFSGNNIIKLEFDKKGLKKWTKKLKRNDNIVEGVTVVGTFNDDIIEVKKIKTPFKAPKKDSGATHVDNYVNAVFEAYKRLKVAAEDANYIKVSTEEVEDATLGTVTEYTYYDSKCKELNEEELLALKPKALSSLGKTMNVIVELTDYQTQLSVLSASANTELETLTGLTVLTAQKNYLNAKLVSAALILEIPKVSANANKTKEILKQLENE
ncbi:hypothetical protein [Winogradskyella helgolandensis]|uniref:hypothetical protein n=1 Tax=Winogradskyella helgolandensis TaxID=2697010 RepID=UPI0015CAE67B|nr:hypothetical protein [Winogradskyella helgolandensis]